MSKGKFFNEGNDCDLCRHKFMTGQDGTVEDCHRHEAGLSCRFEETDIRTCPACGKEFSREDMRYTKDCHGIPYRLVCFQCRDNLMSGGV